MTTETAVTRELTVDLSEAELRERGDAMAEAELKCEELKAERRRLNASIREQTDTRARLAGVIDARKETREVTCHWKPDYKKKRWQLIRSDTNTPLPEEREMTPVDLQTRIDGAEEEAAAPSGRRKKGARKAANKPTR